ncbi:MAG: DUF3078 domain-containing protein [Bacteroidetes bacterium]|nr:DUF3078 domain-containing protein [Bacteroidota bacterium]
MTFRIVLLLVLCSAVQSGAQIVKPDTATHWRKSFKSALNLNQASFSSNWKSGGVNSLGFNALLNYKANYKVDRLTWDNEIDLLYGMVNNAGQGYRKTLDRVFIDSKLGYGINKKWGAFGAMNFMTQFAPGYKYTVKNGVEVASLISSWLAPGFFTTSLGLEYNPVSYFKLRISPIAPRITIVKNSQDYSSVDPVAPYGVVSGETIRYEWLAAQMLAEFNKDVATNINLKFRYLFFANFEQFAFNRFDHRLDLNLTAKVNRFINVSLGSILLYDYDQDASIQLSQAFSLGILYTYRNYEK